jgi:hypothetical protein
MNKMSGQTASTLAGLFLLITFTGYAETMTVRTTPPADGVLIDVNQDGIVDKTVATEKDGNALELWVGKMPGGVFRPVLEFNLPPGNSSSAINSARLMVFLNGEYGCEPNKSDAFGPECWVWYYLSPDADAKIELTDDAMGERLCTFLPAKAIAVPRQAVIIDVTEAVRRAMETKSAGIGFRLEPDLNAPAGCVWRIRTCEFAEKYAKSQCPSLEIITE